MKKKLTRNWLYWSPRVLSILFILFISLFALDSFGQGTFIEQVIGFLIHMIPTFILIIMTYFAWKKPLIGALEFVLIAIGFTIFFNTYREIFSFIFLTIPLLIIASLFYLEYKKTK